MCSILLPTRSFVFTFWAFLPHSPQNLNARKAELLVGLSSLKSVGAQVAKKFEEIKGSISVAGVAGITPVKSYGSNLSDAERSGVGSSATALTPADALLLGQTVATQGDGSLESWSSWTAQWLRRASSADLVSQQYGQLSQPTTGSATPSELSATDGQASSNLSTMIMILPFMILNDFFNGLPTCRRIAFLDGDERPAGPTLRLDAGHQAAAPAEARGWPG